MDPRGTHIIIDLYEAQDPGDRALEILRRLAEIAGCKVLEIAQHAFPGGGQTALVLLSKSHASMHTWPENQYVALDLYSCELLGDETITKILDAVKEAIPFKRICSEARIRGNDL